MATLYITNNADSGDGSFRAAFDAAEPGDTIVCDPNVDWGGDEVEIAITSNLPDSAVRVMTIGDGARRIVFNGAGRKLARAFMSFDDGSDVALNGVAFRNISASGSYGSALRFTSGVFTFALRNCELTNCSKSGSTGYGAALCVQSASEGSTGALYNCVFANNSGGNGSNVSFTTNATATACPLSCYDCTFVGGELRNVDSSRLVNCLQTDDDAGFVRYDQTSSSELDLRLLDVGASVTPSNFSTTSFRVRLGYEDGSFAETTIEATPTPDESFATNGKIALAWTRPDDADADRVAVERSLDGTRWARKAILVDDGSLSSATLCFNPPSRSAGVSRTSGEALDFDGITRRTSGFSLGAYETVEADRFATQDGWSTSRFLPTNADAPTATQSAFVEGTKEFDDAIQAGTLTLAPKSNVTFAANCAVGALNVGDGATVTLLGDERVLSASESVAIGAATIVGDDGARLVAPQGADLTRATITVDVSITVDDAISSFRATAISPDETRFEWTSTDPTRTIELWRQVGDSWELVDATAGPSGYVAASPRAHARYRAFDGATYWYDDAWTNCAPQFKVVAIWTVAESATQHWEAIVQKVATTEQITTGQSVTILARIFDAFDVDAPLENDGANITSVKYTCYYMSNGLFGETREPIAGHTNVDVGTDCVLEEPQTSDAWTRDEVGYNFVLTPDVRSAPLFERSGEYQIKVTIELASGNPVVFYVPVSVVDR